MSKGWIQVVSQCLRPTMQELLNIEENFHLEVNKIKIKIKIKNFKGNWDHVLLLLLEHCLLLILLERP
jgi:hypothetical protein